MRTTSYVSDDLTHFVGRSAANDEEAYERLVSILRDGWLLPHNARRRRQRDENTAAFQVRPGEPLSGNDRFLPEMVCFADIPEEGLAIHVGKYGRFGIALPKSVLVAKGARPVLYVPLGGRTQPLARYDDIGTDWDDLADVFLDEVDPRFGGSTASGGQGSPAIGESSAQRLADWVSHDLLGFVKFFDPQLPADHPENFYMEREWRSVRSIRFSAEDITRVFVASGYEDRVSADLPGLRDRVMPL